MNRGITRAFDNNPELIHTEHAIDRMLGSIPGQPMSRRKAVANPDPQDMADKVLLLKINSLEDKVDTLSGLIRQLMADRYPRYVGTKEACRILGIGSTTMDKRLQAGYYPFAIKENNRWRFPLAELYRFAGQL